MTGKYPRVPLPAPEVPLFCTTLGALIYQERDFIDNPKAVRAVGAANGRNPVAIIVPCHRIIGSGGRAKLTGYGGGLWRKEWLLQHEGVLLM